MYLLTTQHYLVLIYHFSYNSILLLVLDEESLNHLYQSLVLFLHNVDILSDLDLKKMIDSHIDSHAWATLAVRERETSRYLLFEKATMRLCGWKNVKSGEIRQILPMKEELALGFSGIHVVKREILDLIPAGQKLSMTPLYLDLAQDHTINGYLHHEGQWMDVGKYEDVKKLMGDF